MFSTPYQPVVFLKSYKLHSLRTLQYALYMLMWEILSTFFSFFPTEHPNGL